MMTIPEINTGIPANERMEIAVFVALAIKIRTL
jgi:hypothetical protein